MANHRGMKRVVASPIVGSVLKRVLAHVRDKKVASAAEQFTEVFSPHVAGSEHQKDLTYAVRHEVYCEELGLEPTRESLLETDSFDAYSIHCFLEHEQSHSVAGTIRIVRPNYEHQKLPMQKYLKDGFYEGEISPDDLKQNKICEISRLAVPLSFRRKVLKKGQSPTMNRFYLNREKKVYPYVAIGLYFTAVSVLIRKGINHSFVMIEPRLAKSLKYIGFPLDQIGPVTNYNGQRAPYHIRIKQVPFKLRHGFNKLFKNVDTALERDMQKSRSRKSIPLNNS